MKKLFILCLFLMVSSTSLRALQKNDSIISQEGTTITRSKIHPLLQILYDLWTRGDAWSFFAIVVHTKKLTNYYEHYDFEVIKPLLRKHGFLKIRPRVQEGIYLGLEEYIVHEVEQVAASQIFFVIKNTCTQESSSGEITPEIAIIDDEQPGAPLHSFK